VPPSRPARLGAGLALLALGYAVATHRLGLTSYRIDLDVYRIGAGVWRAGGNLYGRLPATRAGVALPFTYPPIAAVLLVPLARVPFWLASLVVTVASVAALVLAVRRVLASTGRPPGRSALTTVAAAALVLEPVRATLGFGQVNLLLLGLVVADCLVDHPWWPRGSLVGIAAAVKLTPVVFVPFLAARHGRRPALTAVLTAVAATAAGALLAPSDSLRYWTSVVFQTDRIGSPVYAGNQSLRAVLARAGVDGPIGTAVWLLGCAVVGALAVVAVRAALRASRPALGLSLTAVAGLLVSPVSWSHHWVWVVPLALAAWAVGTRPARALAVATVAVMLAAPQWWFAHGADRELSWTPVQQLVGSAYVVLGLTILAWAVLALLIPARTLEALAFPGWWQPARLRTRDSSTTWPEPSRSPSEIP
jgi:alpha-1,2-mannosyltransferase